MKRFWPVPQCLSRQIPQHGQRGCFWEDRGDRRHAGVDLYTHPHGEVIAIESGQVVEVAEFTSPARLPYWNTTYSILVQNSQGAILRYAELHDVLATPGQTITAGQVIGQVGMVLNPARVQTDSPIYIQELVRAGLPSMLHFEMYNTLPGSMNEYLGGNFFTSTQPGFLLDPTSFLQSIQE